MPQYYPQYGRKYLLLQLKQKQKNNPTSKEQKSVKWAYVNTKKGFSVL